MASLTRLNILKSMLVFLVVGSLCCVLLFRMFVIKILHWNGVAIDDFSTSLDLYIHLRSKEDVTMKLGTSNTTYSPVATSDQDTQALAVQELTVDTSSYQIISKFENISLLDSSFSMPWYSSKSVSSILSQPWFRNENYSFGFNSTLSNCSCCH